MFRLVTLRERMDGTVFCEWESIADDGKPLIEGDVLTPDPEFGLEAQVVAWLAEKKLLRSQINAQTRKEPKVRVKRSTAVLDVSRIRSEVEE